MKGAWGVYFLLRSLFFALPACRSYALYALDFVGISPRSAMFAPPPHSFGGSRATVGAMQGSFCTLAFNYLCEYCWTVIGMRTMQYCVSASWGDGSDALSVFGRASRRALLVRAFANSPTYPQRVYNKKFFLQCLESGSTNR